MTKYYDSKQDLQIKFFEKPFEKTKKGSFIFTTDNIGDFLKELAVSWKLKKPLTILDCFDFADANIQNLAAFKQKHKDKSVIYGWVNKNNHMVYIGSGEKANDRPFHHHPDCNNKKHSKTLRQAITLHGIDSFVLVFFTKVDTKFKKDPILFLTEDIYLKMVPKEYKYNILESAFDMPIDKGLKASLETKAKMSQAHLGKKHSEETKMKISQTLMGRKAVATTYPKKKVLVTNLQTKEEKTFLSVKDQAKFLGITGSTLSQLLKKSKVYNNTWLCKYLSYFYIFVYFITFFLCF